MSRTLFRLLSAVLLAVLPLVLACSSDSSAGPGGTPDASAGTGGGGGAGGSTGGSAGHAGNTSGGTSGAGTGGASGGGGTFDSGHSGGSGGRINAGGDAATPHEVRPCDGLAAPGTWENITPPGSTETKAVAADPFRSGTLWLANDDGIQRSDDCGAHWTLVSTGTNGEQLAGDKSLWSMALDPVDEGTIYWVRGYGGGSLFKSTDGGVNWTDLFPVGSAYAVAQGDQRFVNNVSMDPADHRHLVISTHGGCAAPYDTTCNAETFDGGATWRLTRAPMGWVETGGIYLLDATTWLWSAPFGGMWRTTDNGQTWKQTLEGYGAAGEFTNQASVPASDGAYYFPSSTQGVLRTTDRGLTWTRLHAEGKSVGFAMSSTTLFIAEQDVNRFYSASIADPTTWTSIAPPSDLGGDRGAPFLTYDEDHHLLYASSWQYGLHRLVVP
jgi:photosystem II stability/assembly factor-like uncharacterized protein